MTQGQSYSTFKSPLTLGGREPNFILDRQNALKNGGVPEVMFDADSFVARSPLSLTVFSAAIQLRADDEVQPAAQPAAEESAPDVSAQEPVAKPVARKVSRRLEKADAFIAPPDWEFDGFVAGGQDQEVRSLYYLNDLIYVNVGTDQGFATGDRVSIFKRGQRVRDPQTGKFLGYEVRRAAATQVTDRIDKGNCSLRILQANEAVEVGDLVRRAE